MSAELQSTSPSGRYQVLAHPGELRMSLWVYPPEIVDAETQDLILIAKQVSINHPSTGSLEFARRAP